MQKDAIPDSGISANARLSRTISFAGRSPLTLMIFLTALATVPAASESERVFSLDGTWYFALDREGRGMEEGWFRPGFDRSGWEQVQVPHTWQVRPETADYYGPAWYARRFPSVPSWRGRKIQLEFRAVYRDASVWLNGVFLGEHKGSGWTPFSFQITDWRHFERDNEIVVRVDNRFSPDAIPYKNSFDWAADGGIIRSVNLRILPVTHIGPLLVDIRLNDDFTFAEVNARIEIALSSDVRNDLEIESLIFDPGGRLVSSANSSVSNPESETVRLTLSQSVSGPRLWHFDNPALYRMVCRLRGKGLTVHEKEVEFGIRRVEARDGLFYLNGEPMRLMGVEWMPGSDPRYGMAQDPRVIREILSDMKRLNCVLTRFHWQQDDIVFKFCDEEGILVQEEIPAWGPRTMEGNLKEIQAMQMREMILSHYNHPSIFAWGLCNEIGGQRKAAREFIRTGIDLGRSLDPNRLLTYASNSLQSTPGRDASALVDFVEWNEYYESWFGGGVPDLVDNLEEIGKAFRGKAVVISEYGLCECSPRNPSGDDKRIEILKSHTDCFRNTDFVAGAIFFDYNDYRTHIGDRGEGPFRQRVHGVVDVFGRRKKSWYVLQSEASPIRSLTVSAPTVAGEKAQANVEIVTRSLKNDLPAYTLRGYLLAWTAYNRFDQPVGAGKKILPDLPPGSHHEETLEWTAGEAVTCLRVEIFRPTGYSVIETEWRPGVPAKVG